jgi:hypothetical protein
MNGLTTERICAIDKSRWLDHWYPEEHYKRCGGEKGGRYTLLYYYADKEWWIFDLVEFRPIAKVPSAANGDGEKQAKKLMAIREDENREGKR